MKNKNTNLLGFTLVELLVVIAIIGILTSVSVINVRSAIDKAEKTKVVTQMKDMQTMAMLCLDSGSELRCSGGACNGLSAPIDLNPLCENFLGNYIWEDLDNYTYLDSNSDNNTGYFCFEVKSGATGEIISCLDTSCSTSMSPQCTCVTFGNHCDTTFDCCGVMICGSGDKCS